jgi:5-methylcytosine-specific restriction endonuclease McrA
MECSSTFIKQKTKSDIESGIPRSSQAMRRYILERDNFKCTICGIDIWLGKPLILIVDHIDGNSENRSLDNLRTVCPNCDSQLSTYKAKNKNSGRFYRRERYKNGQSY